MKRKRGIEERKGQEKGREKEAAMVERGGAGCHVDEIKSEDSNPARQAAARGHSEGLPVTASFNVPLKRTF